MTGCGGWVDLHSPEATGGSASGSAGTAGKPAAVGGAVGTAGKGVSIGRGQSGAPNDSPIANGEGGELLGVGGASVVAPAHGLFQLLQAPPPTLRPAGATAPGVIWTATLSIAGGNLEQGALFGANSYCFRTPGSGAPCDWSSSQPFVWTEASGVVALDHLDDLPGATDFYPDFVSADGQTVVGEFRRVEQNSVGYFRWTKAGGTTRLGEPVGTISGGPEFMNTDGTVVAGLAKVGNDKSLDHQEFLWTLAGGYQALVDEPTWPANGSIVGMSADGSILVGETRDEPKQVFRWSLAGGVEQLGTLPGLPSCNVNRYSKDASTVFGYCNVNPAKGFSFVWTQASGMVPIKQGTSQTSCEMYQNALNEAGTIAFGSAQCGTSQTRMAARWSADTGVVALPGSPTGHAEVSTGGTNRAGNVAFGVIQPTAVTFPEEGVDGAAPFRWSGAMGLVPLQSLPGYMYSYAYAANAAGDVLVGRSGSLNGTSEATLWDGVGAVGVAAYLTTLGADLEGARLQSAQRIVTRDGTTIVQGTTDQRNGAGAWLAWLPPRH